MLIIFPYVHLPYVYILSWDVYSGFSYIQLSSVQVPSHVWLFAMPWTAACQASLSITNSWSLLRFMPIESVMPSNHLLLCHHLLLPTLLSFKFLFYILNTNPTSNVICKYFLLVYDLFFHFSFHFPILLQRKYA